MMDPLNIILLAIAAVVLWKLKSVLGERNGLEKRPVDPLASQRETERDNVIRLPGSEVKAEPDQKQSQAVWQGYADEGSPVAAGLEAITVVSPNFTPQSFLDGSKIAYELVLEAFAKGDKTALKSLLAKDVFDSFSAAIDQRIKAGHTMATRFVGVKSAKITAAGCDGKKAQISVRFIGEMISSLLDSAGGTIEGDPKQVRDVHDQWTFERDVSARDPNWKVVDTSDDDG
jgi:predicted lipid-binding transport protein (Tim44 family)